MNALLAAWEQTVAAQPEAPAVFTAASGQVCTRTALAARARAVGEQLPSLRPGERVVLSGVNSAEWIARLLALWRVGAVPVPLDPSEPAARLREVAEALGAVAGWSEEGWTPLPHGPRRRDRAALIKLTSGSTGRPTALRFKAEELLADGQNVCRSMGITPDDRNLAIIPFGHSYGWGNLILPLLMQGTAIVIARAPLPRVLAEDCQTWQATIFPAVPPLLRLLGNSEVERGAFASLRTVISAGSPLAPETAQAFLAKFGQRVHGFYGCSETGGITFDRSGEATLTGRSVGTALEGVSIGHRRDGRLLVEGAAVYTLGNRRRGAAGQGQYVPTDRAEAVGAGEWRLLGRTGRLVKIAGRRLDLAELEQRLRQVPEIEDAHAAVHPRQPDELAAALQTRLSLADVRARLARALPPWQVPRRLVLYPIFPVTARGKTNTAALRQELAAPPVTYPAPETQRAR